MSLNNDHFTIWPKSEITYTHGICSLHPESWVFLCMCGRFSWRLSQLHIPSKKRAVVDLWWTSGPGIDARMWPHTILMLVLPHNLLWPMGLGKFDNTEARWVFAHPSGGKGQECAFRQVVIKLVGFYSLGNMWQCLQRPDCHSWSEGAIGISWVEAKDVAKHPPMNRTAPSQGITEPECQ